MSDSQFDNELNKLIETCARLHEELTRLRERISALEALRDAAETPEAVTGTPDGAEAIPPTTPVVLPSDVPTEPPPFAQPAPSPTPNDQVDQPFEAHGEPHVSAVRKDAGEFVRRLVSGRNEEPDKYTPPSEKKTSGEGLELRIGGTWLNRAGAIILFLAIAFFAKYSFDQGWISPAMRVIAAGVLGLGMAAVGEYCLHRDMRNFAAGLLGCAICVLYLAVYGAHGLYRLISPQAASLLYMAVTALSVAVSVHGRLLPVAILGVIGGYATPIVLSTGRNEQVALLVYVLALDVSFLVSASIRKWDALRVLSWLGTLLLFGAWYLEFYDETARWVTAAFVLAFYLLFHAEAVVCLRLRSTLSARLIGYIVHADNVAFFGSVYFLLREAIPQWMGLFAVLTAGLQWFTAWRLCGGHTVASRARLSLWLDGAAMLALAAPMQFDRYLVSVSWAVQAVVTLWFCRKVPRMWLRLKGTGVLLAATVHLLAYEYNDSELATILVQIGRWHLSWLIMCFVFVGLCAHAAGAVLAVRRAAPKDDKDLAIGLVVLGTLVLLGIFAAQWERYVAAWWWIGLGVAWWILGWRVSIARGMALALVLAAFLKFVLWDTGHAAIAGFWRTIDGPIPGLNRAVITGIAVAGFGGLVRPFADRIPGRFKESLGLYRLSPAITIVIALTITWTGTFEVLRTFRFDEWVLQRFQHPHHAQGIFITAFWVVNAASMWLICRPNRTALAGYAMVLTWLTMVRVIVFDTLGSATTGRWSELSGICTNRTFIIGLSAIGLGLLAYWRYRRPIMARQSPVFRRDILTALLVVIVLMVTWIPTFEINRIFRFEPFRERFADPRLAMHVALSVLWSLNATVVLILGFLRKVPLLRHLALGLFAITVVKVFLFDLSRLETLYRIISFLVLGVLLLFASLLYQRLSSRLTAGVADDAVMDP